MDDDDRKELVKLGKNYEGVRAELAGIQRLLETLTSNQSKLTAIGEKSSYLEKTLEKTNRGMEELFVLVRDIKGLRLGPRIKSLESNQKWLVITVLGAVAVTLVRGIF